MCLYSTTEATKKEEMGDYNAKENPSYPLVLDIKVEQLECGNKLEFDMTNSKENLNIEPKFETIKPQESIKQELDLIFKPEEWTDKIIFNNYEEIQVHESFESNHDNGFGDISEVKVSDNLDCSAKLPTIWNCTACGDDYGSVQELRIHICTTHRHPSKPNEFKCDSCNFTSTYLHHLRKHIVCHKRSHRGPRCTTCPFQYRCDCPPKFSCDEQKSWRCVCTFKCDSEEELKMHIESVHRDPSNPDTFKCALCSFNTKYIHQLTYHVAAHKKPVKTKSKKLGDKNKMLNVKVNVEDLLRTDVTYNCTKCPFETNDQHQFFQHEMSHKRPRMMRSKRLK